MILNSYLAVYHWCIYTRWSTIKKRPKINEFYDCAFHSQFIFRRLWCIYTRWSTALFWLVINHQKNARDKRILKLLIPISYVGDDHWWIAPGDQLPSPGCLSTIKRPMINKCQNCWSSFEIWALIIDAFTPGDQLLYFDRLSTIIKRPKINEF